MKKILFVFTIVIMLFAGVNSVSALDEGTYVISSSLNVDYSIEIADGKINNGNKIQLYEYDNGDNQKFVIKKTNDGYYKIASKINESYVLDVDSAKFTSGTKVQLYIDNDTDAQKWRITSSGSYYEICAKNTNYCLDVYNGKVANKNSIQIYSSNNTSAQKFSLKKVIDGKQTINDGVYAITTALKNDMTIDIADGRISNQNNIQLYKNNSTDAQKWYVKYIGNGYYSIMAYKNVNYVLDVSSAGKTSGTNVQLYKSNNTYAQKWIIQKQGEYYNIISPSGYLALDVESGSTKNETNIQLYKINNTDAQKFKFNLVKEKPMKTISDGYYFINSNISNNKVIDLSNGTISDGNNIQIYSLNLSLAQKWHIKYNGDGYYSILSSKDELYTMELSDSGNVQLGIYDGSDNQKWIIKEQDGYYYIISKKGYYVDVENANTANCTNIQAIPFNGSKAQQYKFTKTSSEISEKVLENGIYRIASALDNSMVIDVAGGSSANGTNIQLYKTNGTKAQKWKIEYLSSGYYKISSLVDLTKSLDVNSAGFKNGTKVQNYVSNNSLAQQWIIKDAGGGYFYIMSNCNDLYLDVSDGKASNGVSIQMYTGNSTKAQKFKFIKSEKETRVMDVSYHQGKIDWDKVANSGIYGVILRIGYWDTEDERFGEYIKEVKRLGIPYGIYLFSYASTTNGANTEANFTNNIISKYDLNPTLGIYYDLEDWYISADNTSNNLSKTNYDDIARTYINSVSSHVGSKYKVKIYANLNFVNNRFGDYARSQSDWIAHYGVSECGYDGPHSLWQYTSEATLDGIRGYVDMNYLY